MESIHTLKQIKKRKEHMGRIKFFFESLKNIKSVGTVTRSSRYLCQAVVREAALRKAKVVVELGAGDGVMTRHLLKAMAPDAILFSFEILEETDKPEQQEIYYISLYDSYKNGYNATIGRRWKTENR